MEAMSASGIDYTIFFYNPNIHPEREYLLRKDENIRFAEKNCVPFVDADYDKDNWFARARGIEWEPERGVRWNWGTFYGDADFFDTLPKSSHFESRLSDHLFC